MNQNNLGKCNKCKVSLIFEEISNHICFSYKPKSIIHDKDNPQMIKIFDGVRWYPINLEKIPFINSINQTFTHQNNRRLTDNKSNLEDNSTCLID